MSLFFDEEVQRLIDSFAYCFKVKITVFSAAMEELIVGLQNPGSHFCRRIQSELRLRYRCTRQDQLMCERCGKGEGVLVYHCYAGLTEAVLPIRVEDTLIGYGMLGQFRSSQKLPQETQDAATRSGIDPVELEAAFLEQPYFDKASMDNMLHLFSMLIAFIVTREYVRLRRPGLAEQVITWVEQHLSDPGSLEEVAQAMKKSRSTISHTIKKQLGLSYKELCILKRIQRFESLIASDTTLSIREAAAMVGYDDPLYFSRIYKKVRLSSPSTYRHTL